MTPIKILNDVEIEQIDNCIRKIREGLFDASDKQAHVELYPGEQILYHYTSIEKLFNILKNDSMWASRSRFSNDSTEDQALGQEWISKNQYYGDNFILCFCDQGDVLSQWRGYCPMGGASIGFCFPAGYTTYTLLHEDYDGGDVPPPGVAVESYRNRPLPVIYCRPKSAQNIVTGVDAEEDVVQLFGSLSASSPNITLQDIVPYLKNSYFEEERELRIVFNNANRKLENCIRFRALEDGSMVPYIVIKYGDLLEMGRKLSFTFTDKKIEQLFSSCIDNLPRQTIVIPCGQDQATICHKLSEKIQTYKQKAFNSPEWEWWKMDPARIICDGHLPIVSITVAPSPNQIHTKEVIERFCRSRYWLQNVVVKCSEIPYVAPKL